VLENIDCLIVWFSHNITFLFLTILIYNSSGISLDDVANTSARIDYLESMLRQKTDELDGMRFDSDNWKERLAELQVVEGSEQSGLQLVSHLRQCITMIRNSLYRLKRQEKLMKLKSQTDAIELQVLRHDLNHKQSVKDSLLY
jgi:hypothetical protein